MEKDKLIEILVEMLDMIYRLGVGKSECLAVIDKIRAQMDPVVDIGTDDLFYEEMTKNI